MRKNFKRKFVGLLSIISMFASCKHQPEKSSIKSDGNGGQVSFNVMTPLVFDDEGDFSQLRKDLQKAKAIGVDAVSSDVWWGLTEKTDNNFDWKLYDRISDEIIAAGLKWVPILSFHQCGGNVGDDCNYPITNWIESRSTYPVGRDNRKPEDLNYVSEQGNRNREYISVWGTQYVIEQYREYFKEFMNHFSNKSHSIAEINISLGPAGELRYPSYDSHDSGAGYPTRGSLQSYSRLARESFQAFVASKYSTIDSVNKSWKTDLKSFDQISPPTDHEQFYQKSSIYSPYGIDFLSWYHTSLVEHGKMILSAAAGVFSDNTSPFSSVPIGAKMPGVHWRMVDGHYAELSAGIIKPTVGQSPDDLSPGYDLKRETDYTSILTMFKEIDQLVRSKSDNKSQFVLHFTCLEKSNDEDSQNNAGSKAMDLVFWIGSQAAKLGLTIKGENALAGPLQSDLAWNNIENALKNSSYKGVTFLRISDVVNNDLAYRRLKDLIERY